MVLRGFLEQLDEMVHLLIDVGKITEDFLSEIDILVASRIQALFHDEGRRRALKRMANKRFGKPLAVSRSCLPQQLSGNLCALRSEPKDFLFPSDRDASGRN
jgi:hypothetical protein